MRRWILALVASVVLGCSGATMTPVQTATVATSAVASVLQLVAAILAQVSEQAEEQAAKCLESPEACALPAAPTPQ